MACAGPWLPDRTYHTRENSTTTRPALRVMHHGIPEVIAYAYLHWSRFERYRRCMIVCRAIEWMTKERNRDPAAEPWWWETGMRMDGPGLVFVPAP